MDFSGIHSDWHPPCDPKSGTHVNGLHQFLEGTLTGLKSPAK